MSKLNWNICAANREILQKMQKAKYNTCLSFLPSPPSPLPAIETICRPIPVLRQSELHVGNRNGPTSMHRRKFFFSFPWWWCIDWRLWNGKTFVGRLHYMCPDNRLSAPSVLHIVRLPYLHLCFGTKKDAGEEVEGDKLARQAIK